MAFDWSTVFGLLSRIHCNNSLHERRKKDLGFHSISSLNL